MREGYGIADYRRAARRTLLALAACLLTFISIVFIVDPLQHYRQASFYTPMFHNSRYLNAGLIRNFDYDTAVIGTSMIMDLQRPHVNQALGVDMLNLGISGATLPEQRLMFDMVKKAGKAKRIIYGLDTFTMYSEKAIIRQDAFPMFLYDESLLNDIKYLLSYFSLKLTYYSYAGNVQGRQAFRFDRDTAYNWTDQYTFSRQLALKSYRQRYEGMNSLRMKAPELKVLIRNFDTHILPAFKQSPETEFIVFYPPYSYLFWLNEVHQRDLGLEKLAAFKRHVHESLQGMDNVRVYDFQSESDITFDLDNYRDAWHYHNRVSKLVMEAIGDDRNRVTSNTIEQYIESFNRQIMSVDMEGLHREMGIR